MGRIRSVLRSARRHELAAENPIYREILSRRDGMDKYGDSPEHYKNTALTIRHLAERVLRKRKEAA